MQINGLPVKKIKNLAYKELSLMLLRMDDYGFRLFRTFRALCHCLFL